MSHLKHNGEAMEKRKRIKFNIHHSTPTGKYTEVREKQDGTDRLEYRYMGLNVTHCQQHFAQTEFVERDIITDSQGRIKRYIGNTQDIVNNDLKCEIRTVNMISGRDKQVNNKKAQGEQRRKRHENTALSFGVSQSKAYHKAKHAK